MATYYIDPAGNDGTGDGSSGNPWQKLSYAASQVAAGDHTIYVNPGTYPVDSAQANIRAGVKINGAGATSYLKTDYTNVSSYLGWINLYSASLVDGNQSIKNIKIGGENQAGSCAINIIDRNNVEIDNVEIFDFSMRGINIRHDSAVGTTFITGIVIHNCTITDSSDRLATTSCGLIVNKGADGTDIHDNVLTQNGNAERHNGNIYTSYAEYEKNTKFYRNTCTKPDTDGVLDVDNGGWNFHWESGHCLGGVEIYENVFYGGVAVDIAGGEHYKGDSTFSYWIHHNQHYLTGSQVGYVASTPRPIFVDLERTCEDVIVEYNRTDKVTEAVACNLSQNNESTHVTGFRFRYNICTNLGYVPSTTSPVRAGISLGTAEDTAYVSDIEIDNNVLIGNGAIAGITLYAITSTTVENIKIRNNIIQGIVSWGWLAFQDDGGTYENIYAWNNIIWDCVTDDTPYYEGGVSVTNYDPQDNIVADPLFTSITDYSLQSISPAINAGIDVGLLQDFIGTSIQGEPDIGAYEWFAVPPFFPNITLVSTPACVDPVDPTIISRWVATECPINFRLLRRDWHIISCANSGGFLAVNIYGAFAGADSDVISVYDTTTMSMYTGTITDSSTDPVLVTDIPWVAGMDILYLNDHTLYAGYYFEGRLTINGVVEPLTIIASPDSFGYADLDVSAILRTKTRVGKVTNYLDPIMKDTYKSGNFTLEYRGCWWGSAEDYIQEGLDTSPVAPIVWYYAECVRSIEQGCNLSEYVSTDLAAAKWLNQFETPVYWYGLPFDISFIIPEIADLVSGDVLIVTMKVYDSENNQLGGDITENVDVDSLEGFVNNYAIDSVLIPVGASYFTVSITAM